MEKSKDEMLQEELEVNAALREMNLPQPDALMIALGTLLMTPILSKNRTSEDLILSNFSPPIISSCISSFIQMNFNLALNNNKNIIRMATIQHLQF